MRKLTVLSAAGIFALLAGAAYVWLPSFLDGTDADKGDKQRSEPQASGRPSVPVNSRSPQPVTNSKSPNGQNKLDGLSPDEVIQAIEAMPLGSEMESACAGFGRRMAVEDPGKFWAWHGQLKVPAAANHAIVAFGGALAGKNPDAFWALVKKEKPGKNDARLADVFSAAVALSDPARALEIASRLSKEESPLAAEFRKGAIRGAASSEMPEKVVDAFIATPIHQNVTTYEAGNLLKAIRGKNKELAFDTLMKLPEGDYRATVAEAYIREIAAGDPNSAGDLVNRMPPGDTRDYAVGRMLNALMERDADAAIAWAEATSEQKLRVSRIEDLRQHFERSNPSALEALNVKHPPPGRLEN